MCLTKLTEFGILNTLPYVRIVDDAFENIWPFQLKYRVSFDAAMITAKTCAFKNVTSNSNVCDLQGGSPGINVYNKNKASYFFNICLYRYIHKIRKLLVNAPKIEAYVMEIKELY